MKRRVYFEPSFPSGSGFSTIYPVRFSPAFMLLGMAGAVFCLYVVLLMVNINKKCK